jgi:hypothetical protein
MTHPLKIVQKRAVQYWFIDGLAELAAGLVSLFLAALFWLWQSIFLWRWSLPVIFAAGLTLSFGLRLAILRIKERTTYVRTGYAAPFTGLENKRSVIITMAFTLCLLGANYYLSTREPQGLLWSPGLAGSVFAFIFVWTGVLTKIRRFYFLAFLSLCVGIAVVGLGMDYLQGVGALAGVVGLALLCQGLWIHRVYTRQNPPRGIPGND